MEKNTPVKYAICMVLIILAFLVHKTAGYLLFWLFSFIFYTAKEVFFIKFLRPVLIKKEIWTERAGGLKRLAVPLKADLRLNFVWIFAS